jgi:hypothetical protein
MSFISLFVCQRFASHASLDGKTHWQSSTASSHIGDDDSRREFSSYSFFLTLLDYISQAEKEEKRIAIFLRCAVCYGYDDFLFYFILYIHLPLSSADGFDSSLVIHSGDHPDELWAGAFIILIDGATIYYTM